MNRRIIVLLLLTMLLLAAMPVLSACGNKNEKAQPQQEILEPGHSSTTEDTPDPPEAPAPEPEPAIPAEEEDEEEDEFTDLGRASTLDDMMANKEKIHSYYFEQNISASYGDMFVRIWYADGMMKIVSASADGKEEVDYIDCENMFSVSFEPAARDYGILMDFDPDDPDMPQNHLSNDYHQYHVVGTESIHGQLCRILENRQGQKLWVSTKHGFPYQIEYTDPTNDEHFVVTYENIIFNQASYNDVAIPADVDIYQY